MRRTTKLMRRQSDDTETPQQDAPAPEPTAPQDAPPTAEERVALGRCLRLRDAALAQNTRVQFLVEAVRKLGCDPGPLESFVQCVSASRQSMAMVGGFAAHAPGQRDYAPKILMVAEHVPNQAIFDRTLSHELVHAYDHGECDLSQEINRGRFGITKHHQACVKRRSALSLALSGQADPDAAVAAVFDACYADTAPFDRHPN
ncbi:metalloendopeptidase [Aureococcus anophagefferens]|nr:metalloendopeptidase [Aureococcus anophagefferens]